MDALLSRLCCLSNDTSICCCSYCYCLATSHSISHSFLLHFPFSRPYNWQRPLPEAGPGGGVIPPGVSGSGSNDPSRNLPRMSSDVGASRIWNRLLDAAFDNSDRRKHGMGALGRILASRRRATRRLRSTPGSSHRKRGLGGNAADHRPFFTYWITCVQILVMIMAMASYGVGHFGLDVNKKESMVSVSSLCISTKGEDKKAIEWA